MSEYLNEYEAADAAHAFINMHTHTPNLGRAAQIVCALIEWADSHSDGWPYWRKPRQAASRLVDVVGHHRREHLRGHEVADISEATLSHALRPVKAFLTRQEVNWQADLPWAALFPAT